MRCHSAVKIDPPKIDRALLDNAQQASEIIKSDSPINVGDADKETVRDS